MTPFRTRGASTRSLPIASRREPLHVTVRPGVAG
jgi:hypothetical protein